MNDKHETGSNSDLQDENSRTAQGDKEVAQTLHGILSELVDEGAWDASLFLRVSKKRLVALRDETKRLLDQLCDTAPEASPAPAEHDGQQTVYVGLHLGIESPSLGRWEQMLSTVSAYSVGRPVYADEVHASKALRAKGRSEKDSYVAVLVDEADILSVPKEKTPTDRHGHALLTLRVGALRPEHIVKWVCNGKTYRLNSGRLVLQDAD